MKRQFEGFALQGSRLADDPSKSYEEPKAVQAIAPKDDSELQDYDDLIAGDGGGGKVATDFTAWSEEEIRSFLDQRGEDFDDCHTFDALVQRAKECETNTGPATRMPTSTAGAVASAGNNKNLNDKEEEIDPLDAFMAEIDTLETKHKLPHSSQRINKKARLEVQDEEEVDFVAEYLEQRQPKQDINKNPRQQQFAYPLKRNEFGGYNSDEEVYAAARVADAAGQGGCYQGEGYDGNNIPDKRREIDSLAASNHAEIDYEQFRKDFYEPVPEIKALSAVEVAQRQKAAGTRVVGFNTCAPVEGFSQCNFDRALLNVIEKAGYVSPTPIQAQALPIILSGRDVVGVAKTGSGKTAAFVLPMLVHIMDQRELTRGEGPIALIAAPTRELAEQIHRETRKCSRPYKLNVCAAFGGLAKHQQIKEMKQGVEVAVCTPGRMIDLIKAKACSLKRTTYVVLDEADRMFDLGFEPQVRSLLGQTRPDRQTLLFSATMPQRVERLAADALTSPVRITVGVTGTANEDVRQVIEIFSDEDGKHRWLVDHVPSFVDEGEVLVFANQKNRVELLSEKIENLGIAKVAAIHGDLSQADRMEILSSFKKGTFHVLVATDVAARGLDIKTLKTVVNYDAAKDIDTHIHRIGRTGRAGNKEGTAYTLLLRHESRAAADLERCLVAAGQEVPEEVHALAMRDPRNRRGRGGGGKAGRGRHYIGGNSQPLKMAPGGGGLGFGAYSNIHQQQPGGISTAAAAVSSKTAIAGFAASHAGADAHFNSAVGISAQKQQQQLVPPPGPPPSLVSAGNRWESLPSPPSIQAATAPPAVQAPPHHHQLGPAAESAATKHAAVGQHFQTTFVSSGTTAGQGSYGIAEPRAEVVLPSSHRGGTSHAGGAGGISSSGRQLPPPPVPVTQQPLYMQARPSLAYNGNHRRPHQQYQGPPQTTLAQQQSEEVANAIARAKEIAARLTSQQTRYGS
jgi:ATP-dependent RNA helicase DDX42